MYMPNDDFDRKFSERYGKSQAPNAAFRELVREKIERAAEITFNITAIKSCGIFDAKAQPICQRWSDLPGSVRANAVEGLRSRVAREGMRGYFERKRSVAGNELTDEIIRALDREGLL